MLKLKEARERAGLTQKEVAASLNVSIQSVSNWEKGNREPSVETIRKICDVCQVSADELIGCVPLEAKKEAPLETPAAMQNFQIQLKELRKRDGVTMKRLGEYLGITISAVSMYESGKREPDLQALCKIADFFRVSLDELVGRVPLSAVKEAPPEKPDGVEYVQIDLKKSSPAPDQRAALESLVREIVCQEFDRRKPQS